MAHVEDSKRLARHDIEQKLTKVIGNDIRCGECYNKLVSMDIKNADILIDYCNCYKHETDLAHSSLTTTLLGLLRFAIKTNKPFVNMTRDDVLAYQEQIKTGKKYKRTLKQF